ncbi:myeloid cell surface antigen CD33 [Pagrus major]|uniref:myeloid cell surface antigen CD33 n=1 Tax=Pagrus major TaxID=143350 RepID=UPI003CC885CC
MDKERKMMIFLLLVAAISSHVFGEEWKANVVKNLNALVTSCVVIPCSFTLPKEHQTSGRTGIWHLSKQRDKQIFSDDEDHISEEYRGRTQLLGHLNQNNCTLEITNVKEFDTGPFCFRIKLTSTSEDFSFAEDCVEMKMLLDPPDPTLNHPKTFIQDHPNSVTCSVTYTCTSHRPILTWSRGAKDEISEVHKEHDPGKWEVLSILTFTPREQDDHSELTCTATFHGKKTSSKTMVLYVKRTENYNHIIIPTVVGIGTAVIFGFFCIFMMKKYKRRITELQSQDGSVWNRLSRMSGRIRSGGPGPSRSDQRPNNVNSKSNAKQKFSKPRFPSPKSQQKSCHYKEDDLDDGDDYINTADLNVYGNL